MDAPAPVTRVNEPYWMVRTLLKDFKTYRAAPRPLTGRRVRASLRPSLERPVFVIGAPRSGTSFLGRCVAAVPGFSYHAEPVATKAAARHVYRRTWTFRRARRFYRRVYRWLMRVHLDGDCRFAEKTPRNCFLVSFLARAFPRAQFVHILRDGRDAALSYSKKPWLAAAGAASGRREPGGYRYGPYPRFWVEGERADIFRTTTDFHRCIWAWRRHVEAARNGLAALPAARRHTLRYERLVRTPDGEAARLADFLGASDPEARALLRQAMGEGHARSVGGWREELSEAQRATAEREAGALLRRLGYVE